MAEERWDGGVHFHWISIDRSMEGNLALRGRTGRQRKGGMGGSTFTGFQMTGPWKGAWPCEVANHR